MNNVVRYLRESEDEQREKRGEEPLTDREFVNLLLAMKHFQPAEALLAKMYAERDSEAA